jgi:hypothetical protein
MKQFLLYFKTALFSFMLLIAGKLGAQTNFVAKPATFVSANKTAIAGNMSAILDGEGKTGTIGPGLYANYFYWHQPDNPVTFSINMNASSTISSMLFYEAWIPAESVKNVTVRLYDGTTLKGTENIVLPYGYPERYMVALSQKYTTITKVEFVVVDDYNLSVNNPKRASLQEVVFGDFDCATTPSTITTGTNQVLVLNTAIATPIQLATTTNAVGATITGLPAGLTGIWKTNKITISGTPTQTGVFNYSLSTGIGCAATTGTITVSASACTTSPASVN